MGVVDVFDYGQAPGAAHQLTLLPPVPSGSCNPGDVKGFGHAISFANVDGDEYEDLIVGAHLSVDEMGRVYVFFGGNAFLSSPHVRWLGIDAPPPNQATNKGFGCHVASADLDYDGYDELIVGRNERSVDVGRVYLIDGEWLASQSNANAIVTPPSSAYQELVNPQANSLSPNDSFGWRVYALGDLGDGKTPGALDGQPDIAICGEVSDYEPSRYGLFAPAGPSACSPIADDGALWIYYNTSQVEFPGLGPPFVSTTPTPIYTPQNVGCPQPQIPGVQDPGRTGRSAARVEWLSTGPPPSSVESLESYLLVGEPERDVLLGGTTFDAAGQVYWIRIPVDSQTAQIDAMGMSPFLEAGGPVAGSFFGSEILALDYLDLPQYPGQQVVVSSRNWRSGVRAQAGRAFSFTSLPPPP